MLHGKLLKRKPWNSVTISTTIIAKSGNFPTPHGNFVFFSKATSVKSSDFS